MRELDTATVAAAVALRRPARVGRERGGRLPDALRGRARSGPTTSGRDRRGADRRSPGPARRPDELTVFKLARPRGRGPRRGRVRGPARRAKTGPASRSSSDPARGDPAPRGRRSPGPPSARRSSGSTRPSAGRDLSQAREPPADRLLQAPRRLQRGAAGRAGELVAAGLLTASAGQHGPGRRRGRRGSSASRAPSIVPDYAPETKVAAIGAPRRHASSRSPFDELVGGDGERRFDGRRRPLRPSGRGRARHGRERHDRARDPRGPAGSGRRADPVGRRRPHDRHRERDQGSCARRRGSTPSSRTRRRRCHATLAAGEPQEIEYKPSFVDGAGAQALLPRCGRSREPLLDGAPRSRSTRWPSAIRVLAERARIIAEGAGALAPAAALSGRAGEGKIVCIVSGGNIDFAVLSRILAGETP